MVPESEDHAPAVTRYGPITPEEVSQRVRQRDVVKAQGWWILIDGRPVYPSLRHKEESAIRDCVNRTGIPWDVLVKRHGYTCVPVGTSYATTAPKYRNKSQKMSNTEVIKHDRMQRFANLYRNWERDYPDTLQWRKSKAKDAAWWDCAAAVCHREQVSPELLFYVVYGYLNVRQEDAHVPFSANVFRSDSLMYRAVANFRMVLNSSYRKIEPQYVVDFQKELVTPNGLEENARLLAELTCRYFETMLMVKAYRATRSFEPLPDLLSDYLAYRLCENHPFLLLRVAKTPRIRALAAVNCSKLCYRQPWNFAVWEGIPTQESLFDADRAAGTDCSVFYADKLPVYFWPFNIADLRPFFRLDDKPQDLVLFLNQFPLCQQTDLFLATKLHSARSGTPSAYDSPDE